MLECDCWTGIDEEGNYDDPIVYVDPEQHLVGRPPSNKSAVTITTDKWIEVGFAGELTDGEGADIKIRELGRMGETALVFLSDGNSKTYALGIATADYKYSDKGATECHFDLEHVRPGFSPTAIRLMSLGLGGGSPGFDVGSVEARITVESSPPHLPLPCDLATDVALNESLQWTGSGQASTTQLYLGNDLSQVNPDESTPFATLPGDVNVFEPNLPWELGQTYYWRIMETTPTQQHRGEIWQFQAHPHYVVENFDLYTEDSGWRDWYRNYLVASLTSCNESVYAGCNAAKLDYDLATSHSADISKYPYGYTLNWRQPGAAALEVFFRGVTSNPTLHRLFLQLQDGNRQPVEIMYPNDPNDINDNLWHSWRINLTEFDTLDLSDIRGLTLGIRSTGINAPTTGTLFIDDIQLCGQTHPPDHLRQTDRNQDQQINAADLTRFAESWLSHSEDTLPVQEPNAPWCYLSFDENISDIQGNALISQSGNLSIDNHYADFNSPVDHLLITNAQALNQFTRGITISFWQSGKDSIHRADTLVSSDFTYPDQAPELAIGLGLWERPDVWFWQCGQRQDPHNQLTGIHQVSQQWSGGWNHWAFAKDFTTGVMCVYLNGKLLYNAQGQATSLSHVDTLALGTGWYSHYDGLMDDFRIDDCALNAQECAYLATRGTGKLTLPAVLPSDLNLDGNVDWQDFALLTHGWINSD